MISVLFIALVIASRLASGNSDHHAVEGKLLIAEPSQARIYLNAGQYMAIPQHNGDFSFNGLNPGVYLLTVESVYFKFKPIRVEVLPKGRIRARLLFEGGASVPLPLKLTPEMKYEFFEPVASFNPFALFRNPMIILMGVTLLMGLALPKLIDSMDPEELHRLQSGSSSETAVSAR